VTVKIISNFLLYTISFATEDLSLHLMNIKVKGAGKITKTGEG
jgi:hypothetical protein